MGVVNENFDLEIPIDQFVIMATTLAIIFVSYLVLRSESLNYAQLSDTNFIVKLTLRTILLGSVFFILLNWMLQVLIDLGLFVETLTGSIFGQKWYIRVFIFDLHGYTAERLIMSFNYFLTAIFLNMIFVSIYLVVVYFKGASKVNITTESVNSKMWPTNEARLENVLDEGRDQTLNKRLSWGFLLFLPTIDFLLYLTFGIMIHAIFNRNLSGGNQVLWLIQSLPLYLTQLMIIILAIMVFRSERLNDEARLKRFVTPKSLLQIILVTGFGAILLFYLVDVFDRAGLIDTINTNLQFEFEGGGRTSFIFIFTYEFEGLYDLMLHLLVTFESGVVEALVPLLIYFIIVFRKRVQGMRLIDITSTNSESLVA